MVDLQMISIEHSLRKWKVKWKKRVEGARNIPNNKSSALSTESGSLGQIKRPTTKGGTRLTTSNPFCSPNSNTAFSVNTFETVYDQLKGFNLLSKSTSLQALSSTTSCGSGPVKETVEALEVYTTLFTVFAFTAAFSMPSAPSMALLVTTSSGSFTAKSIGVAVWKIPTHPSTAGPKLSGSLRSALKKCSFSDAPGRFVRKLTSLLRPVHAKLEHNYNLVTGICLFYSLYKFHYS